jgi:hypothetical protein
MAAGRLFFLKKTSKKGRFLGCRSKKNYVHFSKFALFFKKTRKIGRRHDPN